MDLNTNTTNNNYLENIFFSCIIKQKLIIQAKYLNSNINEYILENLKNNFEGKCISDGYVQNDSIEIINKSIGFITGSRFTGDVSYDILYKALICNPIINNVIECEVKFINKLGLLCNNGPITIIVGRQFHNNPNLLDTINVDDIIKVSIIDKKFSLNDKVIEVTAKLYNDEKKISNDLIMGDITEIDSLDDEDSLSIDGINNISNNKYIDSDLDSLDDQFDEDDLENDELEIDELENDELENDELENDELENDELENDELENDELENDELDEKTLDEIEQDE